jgi:hypothetical protein
MCAASCIHVLQSILLACTLQLQHCTALSVLSIKYKQLLPLRISLMTGVAWDRVEEDSPLPGW